MADRAKGTDSADAAVRGVDAASNAKANSTASRVTHAMASGETNPRPRRGIREAISSRDECSKLIRSRSKMYVGLIDILFGIIIALSFDRIPRVASQPLGFDAVSLVVAYTMVVASWVGYHTSIRHQPHKTWFRFALDLFLVFDYFVMVNYSSFPRVVFSAYFAMFSLYVLWDALKWVEYKSENLVRIALRFPYPLVAGLLLPLVYEFGSWATPSTSFGGLGILYLALGGILALRFTHHAKPLKDWVERWFPDAKTPADSSTASRRLVPAPDTQLEKAVEDSKLEANERRLSREAEASQAQEESHWY